MVKFPNSSSHAWIEVDGKPLPEYQQTLDKTPTMHRRTVYIPAETGKEFTVHYNIARPPGHFTRKSLRVVDISVDKVFAVGHYLQNSDFEQDGQVLGWRLDQGTVQCFTFTEMSKNEENNTHSHELNKEELMRSCVEVAFYDAEFEADAHELVEDDGLDDEAVSAELSTPEASNAAISAPRAGISTREPTFMVTPQVSPVSLGQFNAAVANPSAVANAALSSHAFVQTLPEDSSLCTSNAFQVKPGRIIKKSDDLSQYPAMGQIHLSGSSSQSHVPPSPRSSISVEVGRSSGRLAPEESTSNERDSAEDSADEVFEAGPASNIRGKPGAIKYVVCFQYRSKRILVANRIMRDPDLPSRGSKLKVTKRKHSELETLEQRKKRLREELTVAKADSDEAAKHTKKHDEDSKGQTGDTSSAGTIEVNQASSDQVKNRKIFLRLSHSETS